MAFLGLLSSAFAEKLPPLSGIPWEWLIVQVFSFIGNYGWRIIVFTLLLKLILMPLEFYQKYCMRKNQKITEKLKPDMEKLQNMYAGDKNTLSQKTMELNKREGYKYFSTCLPMILTLVIFIWLWQSMRAISEYMILKQYVEWYDVYTVTYEVELERLQAEGDDTATAQPKAIALAQEAVVAYYYDDEKGNKESFLWIKSVWSADVPWVKPILDKSGFESAIGGYKKNPEKVDIESADFNYMLNMYSTVTDKLRSDSRNSANGYLIFPILAVGLSFLSTFISQKQQKKTQVEGQMGQMGGAMKIMMFIMPLMMGYFALSYTSAFTIYMVMNSGMTLLINLFTSGVFTLFDKRKDKDQYVKTAEGTVARYGRPDPTEQKKKFKK